MGVLGMTLLTIAVVFLLFGVLVVYLAKIIGALEAIGGTDASLLAHVRWGVRAIERQTDALGPEVGKLNEGLSAVDEGLGAIGGSLGGLVESLESQERRS